MHRTLAFVLLSWLPLAAFCADPAEIDRCRTITEAAERLACFDRASTAPAPASPAPAPASAAPAPVKPAEPKIEEFGKPPPPPAQVSKVTAGLREFARTARGRAVFVLDNGQTWRQVDGDTTAVREPAEGAATQVTIERGIFDTYNLSLSGWSGMVKVRRLQ